MKCRRTHWITVVIVLVVGVSLSADRIKLKSGKVIEGMFVGADSKAVRILLDNGKVTEVAIDDALSVEFTPRKPAPPPPPPNPATRPKPVQVPAGTMINVRLTQGIDVDASQTGQTFKAIVDDPVMMNGSIVIPRGASAVLQAAAVQQSGTMKGSDKISLKMNAIGFGGNVYQVATALCRDKGRRRRQEDGAQSRRRRRPRGRRWRHCWRWFRGGDRCGRRRRGRRRGCQ